MKVPPQLNITGVSFQAELRQIEEDKNPSATRFIKLRYTAVHVQPLKSNDESRKRLYALL